MSEVRYENLAERWVEGAVAVERAAFPTAAAVDLLGGEEYSALLEVFPDGAFVALDGERVVGVGTGIFVDFDFEHIEHTIWDVTGECQCGNHNSAGAWYYGTDIAVLPEYRRRGIGRGLYELRKTLVRQREKRGIVAGAHLPGFADHKSYLEVEDYIARVVAGELRDETLTFQIGNGFDVRGVIEHYVEDPAIDDKAALIVWTNPDFGDEVSA